MNTTSAIALHVNQLEWLLLTAAFICLCGGILCIFFLVASRIRNNRYVRNEVVLQDRFQPALNDVIVRSVAGNLSPSVYQFHLQEIRDAMEGSKAMGKQTIINQLIVLKMNLSGASSKILDKLFLDLKLQVVSNRKLRSLFWKVKAQGIRELTKMNYQRPEKIHQLFMKTTNNLLKEEMFMSSAGLNKERPLDLLPHYHRTISLWNKINLHHHLALFDPRQLPDFTAWFSSKRDDVVLFCLSMVRQFRQREALPAIVRLLSHSNERVVALAIQTLADLEAVEASEPILSLVDKHWDSKRISMAIARFLGKVVRGQAAEDASEKYLRSQYYNVRFEAVRIMMSLNENTRSRMLSTNKWMLGEFDRMIAHVSEPLLV